MKSIVLRAVELKRASKKMYLMSEMEVLLIDLSLKLFSVAEV